MRRILWRFALPAAIVIFCALIGLNTFIASRNIRALQNGFAQRVDASAARSDIAALALDLKSIEIGQQGYLLTGDDSYLPPFTQAVERLPLHFSNLRSRLAAASPEERSLAAALERVAEAKIAEANDTIRLRAKGYRHRAFLIVASNRGRDLMSQANSLLTRLSEFQNRNIALYDSQVKQSVTTARSQAALAGVTLLALTLITLFAFHQQGKRLEVAYREQTEQLRATSERLERLTRILSDDVRPTAMEMRSQAEYMLNVDSGFLPRQGQQRAEWIHEGSCYLNRVLDGLLQVPAPTDARPGQPPGPIDSEPYTMSTTATGQPRSRTA